jgi:hypothetical protein
VRRRRPAHSLRAGDYIHYPCSGCRVRRVLRQRGGAGIGVECELDSGTTLYACEPGGRDLDVTRTLRGWRRFLPVF